MKELRETNNSHLETKQNEIMRIFTIIAFITFPLTLIGTVLEMDSPYNPIKGLPYDFWIITAILIGLGFGMYGFFKHKKWL